MRLKNAHVASLLVLAMLLSSVAMATFTDFSNGRIANRGPAPIEDPVFVGQDPAEAIVNYLNRMVSPEKNLVFQPDQINIDPETGEVRILRTDQKVNLNQFVPHLIKINHLDISAVRELRPIARQICAMEGGHAETVRDSKTGDRFIMVVCPPFQLPYVEAAIKALDKEWLNATDDGSEITLYRARFRDINDVDRVARAYAGGSTTVHELDNSATHLNYQGTLGSWETVAMYADIPIHEISIDAKFYETDTQNDLKLGLDYINWKNTAGANLFNIGAGSNKAYVEDDDINGFLIEGFRISENWRFRSYNAALTASYYDFLASKGKAKLLTEAALTAVSGRMSSWKQADPVAGITVTGDNGPANVPDMDAWRSWERGRGFVDYDQIEVDRAVNYTRQGEVGIFLNILPVIGTESTEMFIGATLSEVNGLTPQGLPTITEASIFSTVRVRDGEQLALGGLTRTEKVKQKNGIPWLSDLPVLGYLFGGETKLDRKKNVVITLESTTCAGIVEKGSNIPLTFDEWTRLASLGDEGYNELDCKGIGLSADDENTVLEATGQQKPVIPATAFGFDQWLLDPAK